MDTAFGSLLLAAGLSILPSLPPAPAVVGKPALKAAPVVEIARLTGAEIRRAQDSAYEPAGPVEVRAAFDAQGESWVKLRRGRETKAFSTASLSSGVETTVGGASVRLSASGDALTVNGARLSYNALVANLYDSARRVRPHDALEYAALVEAEPSSVCLLRKGREGGYFVTYRKPADLKTPQWFAAVNGVLKGFVADGDDLVFIEKALETR
jgi:hypothetical protein